MPEKKCIGSLTSQERAYLEKFPTTGKTSAYKINHGRVLLLADTNQEEGGWIDQAIAEVLNISVSTIERVRRRFVGESLDKALDRQPQSKRKPHRLDGEQEAHLIAVTCGTLLNLPKLNAFLTKSSFATLLNMAVGLIWQKLSLVF
jgi:Winged helix-turn helix